MKKEASSLSKWALQYTQLGQRYLGCWKKRWRVHL